MLRELNNIRSFNDLLKVLSLLSADFNTQALNLKKLDSNLSISTSSDSDTFTIGDGRKTKPTVQQTQTLHQPLNLIPSKGVLKTLQKYAATISRIYATLDSIKIAKHIANRDYGTLSSNVEYQAACEKLINEANVSINEAKSKINALAKEFIPKDMKRLFGILCSYLDTRFLSTSFKDSRKALDIFPVTEDGVDYLYVVALVKYSDLTLKKSETKDFKYRQFFVILTAKVRIDNGATTYHVTASPESKVPGTYKLGTTVTANNINDAAAKVISFYSFSLTQKTPIPPIAEVHSVRNLPYVKRVKIVNDVVTILFDSKVSDSNKNSAINAVLSALKNAFKSSVTFSVNQERSLQLNKNVSVKGVTFDPSTVKKYSGNINTPLLQSDEAKVAIVNDLETFTAWVRANETLNAADNEKSIAKRAMLEKKIGEDSKNFPGGKPSKHAPANIKAMYDTFTLLDLNFKNGKFKPMPPKDVLVKYNSYIDFALKAKIIKERPESTIKPLTKGSEKYPVVHILLQANKLNAGEKSNAHITGKQLEMLRDELKLNGNDIIELKKLLFLK